VAEDKEVIEKEIIVGTEPAGASQKSLGRPMLMLLLLIGAALAGIGILMAVLN
jgi:hypothetical protein